MSYVVSVWEPPAAKPKPASLEEAMKERDAMCDRPDTATRDGKLVKLGGDRDPEPRATAWVCSITLLQSLRKNFS
jgi:hypothetical protein